MRKKMIPEKEIINLSKNIIQGFYNRDISESISYLADDFMWIGALDFQFTMTREEFLEATASELNATPFKMANEEFFLLSKNPINYVVCAKFKLIATLDDKTIITTHTRLTIIWEQIKDELKLSHIHGSNAQDIPLSSTIKNTDTSCDNDFFTYLTSIEKSNSNTKISFKDINGKYRYFLDYEIIYLEANLQNTLLHTSNECIKISGLLAENMKNLPQNFYRVHKSYIVNTTFVTALEHYKVTIIHDKKLPVSKEKFIAFRDSLRF